MLTPTDILRQTQRKYLDFVAAYCRGEAFFPLPVRFGLPSPSSSLGQLRREIEELWLGSYEFKGYGYRIEFEQRRMRLHGEQRMPVRVWFENDADFLRFIAQTDAFHRLQKDIHGVVVEAPQVEPWIRENGRMLVASLDPGDGRALGLALSALQRRPKPNCFAREIALPGVSGKFIENNLQLIATILRDIESTAWTEGADYHSQLGLRTTPRMLRLMLLDGRREDFGVPHDRFIRPAGVNNVLVVENLRSFLTLPDCSGTLAVFGEGRASQTLTEIGWLSEVRLFYWGDLDPYGFSILAGLRGSFSGVQSVMMDDAAFQKYGGLIAPIPIKHFKISNGFVVEDPSWNRLSSRELAGAQASIQDARVVEGVWYAHGIEQEKIPLAEAANELLQAFSCGLNT
ncbi:MAG: hypothetical protein JWM68_2298 [Verrucomicrobiales bacterium]|nr:hypothetical protein [Verrucomicrobiales bacterium]